MVKRRQSESALYLGTSTYGHMISVNRMSSFIPKYFLQNLKNLMVTKWTIDGGTLGRLVDSWVAFGDRATIFQQHCLGIVGCRLNSLRLSDAYRMYRVSNLTSINSDNGLSPGRHQAITWANAGIVNWTQTTNFSEILIEIQTCSFKKIHFKMLSVKCCPFCLGLNVLNLCWWKTLTY